MKVLFFPLQMAECLDQGIIIKFELTHCKPVTLLPYRGALTAQWPPTREPPSGTHLISCCCFSQIVFTSCFLYSLVLLFMSIGVHLFFLLHSPFHESFFPRYSLIFHSFHLELSSSELFCMQTLSLSVNSLHASHSLPPHTENLYIFIFILLCVLVVFHFILFWFLNSSVFLMSTYHVPFHPKNFSRSQNLQIQNFDCPYFIFYVLPRV